MQQNIRLNTFETNSSSMHSLSIMDKEDIEKFENEQVFWYTTLEKFITPEQIPELEEFGGYDSVDIFLDENCDTDYAVLYTYHYLDYITETVYDKEGNEKVAFSAYISG